MPAENPIASNCDRAATPCCLAARRQARASSARFADRSIPVTSPCHWAAPRRLSHSRLHACSRSRRPATGAGNVDHGGRPGPSDAFVDFLVSPGFALSGRLQGAKSDPAPRHGLRQLAYTSSEGLAIYPNRLATNRGNAYLPPNGLASYTSAKNGIFPNFDCKNTDYTPTSTDTDEDEILPGRSVRGVNNGNPPDAAFAPCFATTFPNPKHGNFGDGRAPQLFADP